TRKQTDAYTYTAEELVADAVRKHELTSFSEIHMVGGESPHVGFDYYVDIVRSLHEALPEVHLKLFTASEIHHMTKLSGLSHEEVLRTLRDAGLGSLPGGGAEVFADRVRKLIAPGKEHPDFWFHTHDTAHRLGIPSRCTSARTTCRGRSCGSRSSTPPARAPRPSRRSRSSCVSCGTRDASRCSATRSTTRCSGGETRPHLVREHGAGLLPAPRRSGR